MSLRGRYGDGQHFYRPAVMKAGGTDGRRWIAVGPRMLWLGEPFVTHAEALAYANTQARATMPTAAQIDQAEAAQDAELDGFTADAAAWDEANVNDALRERP